MPSSYDFVLCLLALHFCIPSQSFGGIKINKAARMQDDYSTSSSVDDKEISSSEPSSSYNTNQTGSAEGGRDEVKEIERLSQKETSVIRTWRIILLVLLLLTAVSVTTVTYILLKSEDENAYKAVVSASFILLDYTTQIFSICLYLSSTFLV